MSKFNFIKTSIEGVIIIEPTVFGDQRGYFMETYNKGEFDAAGLNMVFVQDNESRSKKGVLRGLHFQKKNPQGKLVRVIEGEVFDVAVDLRKGSPTFGKWEGVVLSSENKKQFYIPEGFAHGFVVLSAVLRGVGDAVRPVAIIGIGICLFRVVWMVTVFARFGTLFSLCLSYVVSWVITSIALLIYYKKGDWMKRRKIVDK